MTFYAVVFNKKLEIEEIERAEELRPFFKNRIVRFVDGYATGKIYNKDSLFKTKDAAQKYISKGPAINQNEYAF